jgi:membrane protein DedA with SNARE-associated domain
MLEALDKLIVDWGYWALFFGSLIEGESVVFTISSMAFFGKFNIIKVMLIAFFASWIADQSLFHFGKYIGPRAFNKWPILREKSDKVLALLKKHESIFILSFRFIYGIRIASPIILGFSKVSSEKFTILNFFSAALWSILSCSLGYGIGAFASKLNFQSKWVGILFSLLIVMLIISISQIILRVKKYRKRKQNIENI